MLEYELSPEQQQRADALHDSFVEMPEAGKPLQEAAHIIVEAARQDTIFPTL